MSMQYLRTTVFDEDVRSFCERDAEERRRHTVRRPYHSSVIELHGGDTTDGLDRQACEEYECEQHIEWRANNTVPVEWKFPVNTQ